jgi:hypothetical protein
MDEYLQKVITTGVRYREQGNLKTRKNYDVTFIFVVCRCQSTFLISNITNISL